jgi:hypothetical protein
MVDINIGSFSLSTGDSAPQPRSTDSRSRQPYGYNEDEDTERLEKEDLDRYWKIYENDPIVSETINSFASRVVEDGYYLEGDNQDMVDDVGDWLETSAILEGNINQKFTRFLKKTVIQREVKGTVLIEKVRGRDNKDKLAAFKFIPPGGLEIHTKPNQSILVPPKPVDDDDVEDYNAPTNKNGRLAAYVQTTHVRGFAQEADEVLFARDEVLKIVRDADIGEIKGTSRIKPIADRSEGLRRKLEDNDEAIASKAYPLWLFKFGSDENPWDGETIESFMESHEMENFHPGMKQGVRGDIDVETISGEVAEIAESLQFDVDFIMSAMPMPKYTVGFEQDINQFVSNQQKTDLKRQIREARNEIEDEFTPALREKAKELGYESDADSLHLRVGKPDMEDIDEENVNVIRYLGVDKDQRDAGQEKNDTERESNLPTSDDENVEENVWNTDVSRTFSLQNNSQAKLSESIERRLIAARSGLFDRVREDIESRRTYSDTSSRALREYTDDSSLRQEAKSIVESIIDSAVIDEEVYGNPSGMQKVDHYTQSIMSTYNNVVEDMFDEIKLQMRRGAERGDDIDAILSRVENKFNDDKITQRSNIIAHMETKNIEETTKLEQYERNPDVIGYRFVNENPETELSNRVSGSEVHFDDDEDYVAQLEQQVSDEYLRKGGFKPIPSVPPIKYGDTTTIEPIYGDN